MDGLRDYCSIWNKAGGRNVATSVLITGVGAIIGQGIIKSLRSAVIDVQLVGIDANPRSVGFHWCDSAYVVPRADSPEWVSSVIDICRKERVAIVLAGIEQDVKALLRNRDELARTTGAILLVNSPEALRVGFDKWELNLFARENFIRVPETILATKENVEKLTDDFFPALLKPRRGMAGKGIYRIDSRGELLDRINGLTTNDCIVQRFIGNNDEEYTVSAFGFKNGEITKPIALKRKLNYGSTFEAETVDDRQLRQEVSRIAEMLKIIGPTNFQFRRDETGDFSIIEVNPRFSSSTSIKSAFGFNEPLMAVKSFVLGEPPMQPELKWGRCSRYIEDFIEYRCNCSHLPTSMAIFQRLRP